MQYLSAEEAAKRAGGAPFFQNVRKRVIPLLIKKGLLNGNTVSDKPMVADDAALQRMLGFGIEGFVYNQQGWSFTAVHAPIDQVSAALARRPGVLEQTQIVKPMTMNENAGIEPSDEKRDAFLVQMKNAPDWSILIQTVHWFKTCDAVMGAALAAALSKDLKTTAVTAWDDDFSGSSMIICEKGKRERTVSDEVDGWEAIYTFFYEQEMYLPNCFISNAQDKAILHLAKPDEVQRADHVVLAVPPQLRSGGPHVFEKIGLLAAAATSGVADEDEFMGQMNDGIWAQAEAVLKGGRF